MAPTSSPLFSSKFPTDTFKPIRIRISSRRARVGFIKIPGNVICESGKERRSAQKKCRARKISGHVGVDGGELLSTSDMRGVSASPYLCTERTQREFAVIARTNRFFDNGLAIGE